MSSKLKPIEPPFSPEVENILKKYPKQNGYLLKLFRVFAHSVRFLTKGVPNLLDENSPLSVREREIVILRTTANANCEYEWGVHVAAFAKQANLDSRQVNATRMGHNAAAFESAKERALLKVIDQLMESGCLESCLLAEFRMYWSKEEQLEICALCGSYQTVSYVANISEVSNEPFAPQFPKE
jgi:alkylhydroperoxidase family enzyme